MKFLIINGPNLNMLGKREHEIYGHEGLEEIRSYTEDLLRVTGARLEWFQSNHEGEIVERIQQALNEPIQALVINPGAYSHTSVAILDALRILSCPKIEVHLSHTVLREPYRQVKLTAQASTSIMEGFGKDSYYLAIWSQLIGKKAAGVGPQGT